jgi:peptide/nickel transport system permease protein
MEWVIDETREIPVDLFSKDFEYKLLGLFPTNVHLLGFSEEARAQGAKIYLLGTDRLGRDQWSRLMYGTRISMSLGLVGVTFSVFLGLLLGGLSGYLGGPVDTVIQRLIELLQSLPTIPLWLALTAALPSTWSVEQVYFAIVLILSLVTWSTLGREVRGRFLSLREEDFVVAAKLAGAGQMRIIFKHMIPAFTSHIIATSTLAIPVVIINEASLSFLGLGLRPPAISWGVMLQEAQNLQSLALAPWLLLPGVAIILTVLGLNLVGDGLRDAADPYSS